MHENRNAIIKTASVYAGTILGAGFASGQEILRFFVRHGLPGVLGLILSGVLFSVVGWAVLLALVENRTKSYDELIVYLLGKRLGKLMEYIVVMFLIILFCTMLAAGGEAIGQTFSVSKTSGTIIIALLCFITFLFDQRGIVEINTALCPLLIVGGIFIGVYLFMTDYITTFNYTLPMIKNITDNWFFSAVVYVSYNIITAVAVLASLDTVVKNKETAKYGGIIGGFSMGILGLFMALPLFVNYAFIKGSPLPMLSLVEFSANGFFTYLYLFVLLAAIFTTAVANGFAIITWFQRKLKMRPINIKISVVVLGIILSQIGFVNFVRIIYPFFGYIGLFEIVVILFNFLKHALRKS